MLKEKKERAILSLFRIARPLNTLAMSQSID